MWSTGDRVKILVPAAQQSSYPQLHNAEGVIEFISVTGNAHVAMADGGTAVLDQRWLYPIKSGSRKAAKRLVSMRVERMEEMYCGTPTGRIVFHASNNRIADNGLFRGCPLGRGYSEADALADFVYRANADDATLKLKVSELNVTERRGF